MRHGTFLGLSFVVLMIACTSTKAGRVGDYEFPPRPEDYPIAVFIKEPLHEMDRLNLDDNEVTLVEITKTWDENRATIEVGFVQCNGAPAASWAQMLRDAKFRARQLGGDAILVEKYDQTPIRKYGGTLRGGQKSLYIKVLRYENLGEKQ